MFRYYIITIVAATAAIFGINAALIAPLYGFSYPYLLALVLLAVVEAFAIDAIVALAVRYLVPKKFYDPLAKRFRCHKKEKKIYTKLGIRKWKDKIPETGGLLVGFQKKKVLDLHDNEYLYKFMQETCYAEVMHVWSIPLGFLTLALCPTPLHLTVALPVAIVNAILQILPVAVQRFIRPQLLRVYNKNLLFFLKNEK